MGVVTTADEIKYQIADKLSDLYTLIGQFVDPNTWGSDDYKVEYLRKMHEARIEILKIREKLDL